MDNQHTTHMNKVKLKLNPVKHMQATDQNLQLFLKSKIFQSGTLQDDAKPMELLLMLVLMHSERIYHADKLSPLKYSSHPLKQSSDHVQLILLPVSYLMTIRQSTSEQNPKHQKTIGK